MKGEIKLDKGKWKLYLPANWKPKEMMGLNDRGKYYLEIKFYPKISVDREGSYPPFYKDFTGATYIAKEDMTLFKLNFGTRAILK